MIVDPTDVDSLKKFFDLFRDLSNPECGVLVGRHTDTIKVWRKKCNEEIKRDPFVEWRRNRKREVKEKIPCPEVWDCAEWLREQYEGHRRGVRTISTITGINMQIIYRRLKKYGIQMRTPKEARKSDNPCCSDEWLYYHYARREEYLKWCDDNRAKSDEHGGMALPLRQCAELAGVVPYTILNWLTLYRMRIRSIAESTMLNRVITDVQRRISRDHFFESYRKGIQRFDWGNSRFSNGIRMDKKKTRANKTGSNLKRSQPD